MKKNQLKPIQLDKTKTKELKEILDLSSHHVCAVFASDCVKHIMGKLNSEFQFDHKGLDAIEAVHRFISGDITPIEAKAYAQLSHALAHTEEHIELKFFYRACGFAAATVHMKKYAIKATYYAIKALSCNKEEDIKDIIEKERQWQIKHLLDIGLRA